MTANLKQMTDAVRAARDAVSDLDEPFKTEGFKILLAKLLSADGEQAPAAPAPGPHRGGSKTKSGTRKVPRVSRPTSSLRLDVPALKELKNYCERFELQGSEQIAFILANYARENTDLEFITAADIEYLYRQLVSQRVKVSPVNDLSDWTRALNWLTAPSRRKEWLAKCEDGHIVSNTGLLRFHELEEQAANKLSSDSKA